MSGPPAPPAATPGQAAYEAWQAVRWPHKSDQMPWDHPDVDNAAFDAAAQAAIALGRLADPAREKVTIERDEARKVAAEMLEAFVSHCDDPNCPGMRAMVSEGRLNGWRERLGGDHA